MQAAVPASTVHDARDGEMLLARFTAEPAAIPALMAGLAERNAPLSSLPCSCRSGGFVGGHVPFTLPG